MHHKHAWCAVLSVAAIRVNNQIPALFLVGGLFALVIGAIGLTVGLGMLSSSQDFRQQASSPSGTVEVALRIPSGPVAPNQNLPLTVLLNTKGMQVDGVQLAIAVPKTFADPVAQITSTLPLQIVFQQLEQTTTTTIVKLIIIHTQISQPFSTTNFEPIVQINSTPTQGGTFEISADNTRSIITRHNADPPQDVLKPISPISLTVSGGPPITAPPSPTASPTVVAGASPTPTPPCTTFTRPEETHVSCIPNQGLSITWTDTNPNSAHPAEEAGFKIYRIDNDPVYTQTGTPGNAPVATLPNHSGSGPMSYVYPNPEVRFGYTPGKFYRFLIYTWKEPAPGRPIGCYKQSAIGTTCPTTTIPTATPTLTITPTPSPTIPATSETTWLAFATKLQGLQKPKVVVKAQVWLEPLSHLDAANVTIPVAYVFDLPMITAEDGLLYPSTQLVLNKVPTNQKYIVYVKTSWSLRKKLGEILIIPGENKAPLDWAKTPLLVGDFVTTPQEQFNKINILDLSAMLRVYSRLTTPVTDANQQFDVDYDNQINILDLSLVLSNYTKLEVIGE